MDRQVKNWRDEIAYLGLTSFIETNPIASHYYADITFQDEKYDLLHKLSRREAADMNKSDGKKADNTLSWSPGDELSRYTSKDDAVLHAKRQWRKLVPDAQVLIEGSAAYAEPQLVLDGLAPETTEELNKLYQECEDLGWWDDGNTKEVKAISKRWHDVIKNSLARRKKANDG